MPTDETERPQVGKARSKDPDPDLSVALTPRQILGGFALLAALVMLLRRRKRDR